MAMATTRTNSEIDTTEKKVEGARTIDFSVYHDEPEQLGLIGLGLTDTELKEQVIPYIKAHPEIELVQLSDNNLTDVSSEALSELTIRSLILEKNKFTQIGAMVLAKNTHFIAVNLNYNDIGDEGLKAFKDNTNILTLHVRGNKISNEGVRWITVNQTLRSLSLEENPITNAGIFYLPDMISLERVALGGTKITHEGFLYLKQDEDLEILTINDEIAIPQINSLQELLDNLKIYDMENSEIILQTLSLDKLRQILLAGNYFQTAVSNQAIYVGDEYNAKRVLLAFTLLYRKTLDERVASGSWYRQPKKEKSPAADFLYQSLTSPLSLQEIDAELDKHPEFNAAFNDRSRITSSVSDLTAIRDQVKLAKDPAYREAPAPMKGWFW
jgi:hypothetical protein